MPAVLPRIEVNALDSPLDLKKLRYFVQVAEQGSFTRAAASLAMAQSAVSRHVRDLETELGVPLLYRNGRGAAPTAAGHDLLARSRHILEQAEILVADMRAHQGDAGSVALGLPPSVSPVLLPPLLEKLDAQLPSLRVHIMEGFSGHVYEWMLGGQLDFAILYNLRISGAIPSDHLLTEDMFLICSAEGSLATQNHICLNEVAQMPLILPALPHGLRMMVDDAAGARGIQLIAKIEVDALATIKTLVESKRGNTILPLAAVMGEVKAGTLAAVPIIDPVISRQLILASSSRRSLTRTKREVGRLLRLQIAELVESGCWPACRRRA